MEAFPTSVEMAEGGCNCIGGVMEDNGSSEAGDGGEVAGANSL